MSHVFLKLFAAGCDTGSFLGFPKWYKYLEHNDVTTKNPFSGQNITTCEVTVGGLEGVPFILAAVVEILIRVTALIALGYVVWGGVQFITSQGEPDRRKKALHTVTNALIGLVIAIASAGAVSFIASRFN